MLFGDSNITVVANSTNGIWSSGVTVVFNTKEFLLNHLNTVINIMLPFTVVVGRCKDAVESALSRRILFCF